MPIPITTPLPIDGRDRVLYAKIDVRAADDPLRSLLTNPKEAMDNKLNPKEVSTLLFSYSQAPKLKENERAVFAFLETSVVNVQGPEVPTKPSVPTRSAFFKEADPLAAYKKYLEGLPGLTEELRALLLGTPGGSNQPIHIRVEDSTCFVHVHLVEKVESLIEFHLELFRNPEFLLVLVNNPSRPLLMISGDGSQADAPPYDFEIERSGSFSGAYQATEENAGAVPSYCGKFTGGTGVDPFGNPLIIIDNLMAFPWPPP